MELTYHLRIKEQEKPTYVIHKYKYLNINIIIYVNLFFTLSLILSKMSLAIK